MNLRLHPRFFGPRIREIIREKVDSVVEGSCDPTYGFIISVVEIISIGNGLLDDETGFAKFPIKYKALVFNPFQFEVLDAVVISVNETGILTEVGPLVIFISKQSIPEEMKYDGESTPPCYKNADESEKIMNECEIRLQIIGLHPSKV
ncbi:DNA-directed RNA polymerase ii subunit rpb7 [Anaeramoeba flamelloides]|uniref:DNA-directed RNA polymerase ii subunit rpb7 n=1 Tax=Anaeramoeba flamelloides TaxID=1746091 RepID=A0AAV7Z7X4_9EUKA|nr:DNA-directed RNA polymerase ii subunit rpb7 [Anaeramoeba flamelloides]KAJ3437973.1 DNA-directed RNA polymerase ii subunit rpb7 [Anaeramoeba flamelloides]KAJ6240685.1 DNA-directed RNA polymerase ii subunit rpb7 [Anaeramoeba flamelloides]KAJ6244611.1 DNA-directed RNA polymerase ii subunit rpb7 [Anaeramoeba flamelloides]